MPNKEEFLGLARKRFEAAKEDEKDLRLKFISDLKFASPDGDDQWDPQLKLQREAAGRPAMAFPRCHTFVQQVSNEARQNKPQIKFAPRLDADKDTAEIYEGLARYIQYASDAQVAYETAIEYSAGASFGYYRFLTDYCDDPQYDDVDEDEHPKDLKIVPVLDPLAVYGILVPACFNQKPRFGFVIEEVPKEEYKARYPKSEMASLSWEQASRDAEGWVGSETVRIAEYWYTEGGEGKRKKPIVKFCKINGLEILPDTETTFPGSSIPIFPVLGKQMIMEGKPKLFSVVRPQKAAQQLINYSKSRIAETLSTAPISPFMVAEGQIDAVNAKQWETLNTVNRPFLMYKALDLNGHPAPPPQRQTFEPPIQSLSSFVMQEVEDMKATTGIFDASLGAKSNETTGKAILARQQQSNLSTMHYLDNLERSFKQAGAVLSEIIPLIYDTEREIAIMGADEAQKVVQINKPHKDEAGKERNYDMTKGKYAVVVTMGRAFATKRMESFDMYQGLVQSAPNLLPMFGDMMFRNSDVAGADIVADRFHALLPPAVQDKDNPLPPEARAAVAQAQQQAQALQQQVAQDAMEKQAKVVEHQGKLQQIQLQGQVDMALEDKKQDTLRLQAQLDRETKIAVAEITTKAQNERERNKTFADVVSQSHEQAHEAGMQAQDQAHQQQMAQQQHEQGLEMADQQAQTQSALSAQNAEQSAATQESDGQ